MTRTTKIPDVPRPKVEQDDISPERRRQRGADVHQPVRGNEPPTDGKRAGDAKLRGETRNAQKSTA